MDIPVVPGGGSVDPVGSGAGLVVPVDPRVGLVGPIGSGAGLVVPDGSCVG